MKFTGLVLALALSLGFGHSLAFQSNVAPSDLQRLQDQIYEASNDISRLRSNDPALARQLQAELDDARDEVVYLRVKLRKNETVARSEYSALRDRVESIRSRASGDSGGRYTTSQTSRSEQAPSSQRAEPTSSIGTTESSMDVPVGTEFDVTLQRALSSETAQVEDRVDATTSVDFRRGDRVIVPAGSTMRGIVSSVHKAGRIERTGKLTVAFDRLTIDGRSYPIRGTVTQALESQGIRGDAGKIGVGAGVGAVIGAILGGAKGALAGVLIGGGGTIAATEGKDVELPPGTVLRVRIDSGMNLR
jgi:hypothetical protein